jgi:hypothetical protein
MKARASAPARPEDPEREALFAHALPRKIDVRIDFTAQRRGEPHVILRANQEGLVLGLGEFRSPAAALRWLTWGQ